MPLWALRTSTSSSQPAASAGPSSASPASPPSASSSNPPPGFLANHHRKSSSTLSHPSRASDARSQAARGAAGGAAAHRGTASAALGSHAAAGATDDDEAWDEGSDDEAAVAQLAGKLGSATLAGGGGAAAGAAAGGVAQSPTSARSPTGGGGWSFNPFASGSAPRGGPSRQHSTSSAATATAAGASPSLGAEAVAAALLGKPPPPQRGASYLAGASKVQAEADQAIREEEKRLSLERGEQVDEPEEMAPGEAADGEEQANAVPEEEEPVRGEGWAQEQCRKAIRTDADDLVKGELHASHHPAHVLARLQVAWAPAPPPAPSAHRTSISSLTAPSPNPNAPEGTSGADGDDDDDPSLTGYVQLDAPSLSSQDPSVVNYDAPPPNPEEEGERGRVNRRKRKFLAVLGEDNVDLGELRKLAWSGVPNELRTMVWQLLLGYLPAPASRRATTLARKRSEYASLVRQAFSRGVKGLDGPIWHQISIDVPRTRPGVKLWMTEATQRSLERVLCVWAIRHPASGYVQGINDLVTPFFEVFLEGYIVVEALFACQATNLTQLPLADADPETFDVSVLPPPVLEALEADSFWCLSKLLDGIQDNYIFAQPGIQRLVKKMDSLCARVDAPLAAHLKEEGVEFIQFAFRWMNCLLMRELSVKNIVRMWDTYLAEGGDAFSEFHLYVCLAFLVRWSDQLREMDFQSIIIFLQSLPTQDWTDKDTELLLSEAFLWSRTFQAR
ncbi:hypothetical protein Rhopal_005761-T1 [Rhodotorula paludigena]|uniref:Rab-GAP TBC domain-containing protein n=1 Tax=Rhodotorula paludigena TaxID=86838 RepID=A0AAV5GS38_9BASI|nr:hypothetical protein Rhopal_005761-T1 [Rhodotorula paludigena]